VRPQEIPYHDRKNAELTVIACRVQPSVCLVRLCAAKQALRLSKRVLDAVTDVDTLVLPETPFTYVRVVQGSVEEFVSHLSSLDRSVGCPRIEVEKVCTIDSIGVFQCIHNELRIGPWKTPVIER
jgi:hypothetical protein